MMISVVCGFAPQVRCELEVSIPRVQRTATAADFSGCVGEGNRFHIQDRNDEGQMVADFTKRVEMAVVNTFFQNKCEHRVTCKSGSRSTQVDYILCRGCNLKEVSSRPVYLPSIVICRMKTEVLWFFQGRVRTEGSPR